MNKNNFNVCENPFNYIEVHANGDFTLCCPHRINNYTIGNFYKNQNFSEIWLGDKAIKFRESILNGSYKYCNLHLCDFRKIGKNTAENHKFSSNCDFPLRVNFAYDKTCNVKCITCRDKQIITEQENMIFLDSLIDTTFIPMLKNAKIVALNGAGEVFASKHMQKLIKEIIINYPNIKFNIQSNGIYFDKTHCDELGITKNIDSAYISIHAATKKFMTK